MHRVPKLVGTRPLRKSVSIAAATPARPASPSAGGPVLARVRDSLVLRIVKPRKAAGDERRAR